MKTASRTLVKSQPELWELIDQPNRMQGFMCALLGRAAEVTVSEREPESLLCWKAADDGEGAWIKVELAEKGWGTHVEVSAENAAEPVRLDGWLDAILDELANPQKRPFAGMTETPADTSAEAVSVEPPPSEPAEEPPVEPEPVEEEPMQSERAPVGTTPAKGAAAETPPAPKRERKKRRRFFGF